MDAGTPEGKRTPVETYAFPPEYVPEAGPTLATAPLHPGLSDQVAQLARDLCLDQDYSAPAGDFPPQAPSSTNAARASLDGKVKSRTRTWAPTTARALLPAGDERKDHEGAPRTDENCVGLWKNEPSIVPSRHWPTARPPGRRRQRRASKHHRTRSMSESSPSSDAREPRSATGRSTSRSTLSVRIGSHATAPGTIPK